VAFGFCQMAIIRFFEDLLFPKRCLGCGEEGSWLCSNCQSSIKVNLTEQCPICRQESPGSKTCNNCRDASSLDGLVVIGDYNDKLLQEIIKSIKYDFAEDLSHCLSPFIANYFSVNRGYSFDDFVLIPVPLYHRRYLTRGFNQAELISQEISQLFGNKIETNYLIRNKYLRPQAGLPAGKRFVNIHNNFKLNKKIEAKLLPQRVLLVDDVFTTGATTLECAKVLRAGGVKNIWGLALARG